MTTQNRLLASIAALWTASIAALVVWLVATRDTEYDHRGRDAGAHRVFDWPVLYLWLGVISAAAVLAVVLVLVWTEASE